jgi:hypothetical protein
MEHQLWKEIVSCLRELDKSRSRTNLTYSDARVIEIYYWGVVHDRSSQWACCKQNWPLHLRKKKLISDSQLSRRLRSKSVCKLLALLEKRVVCRPENGSLVWYIDGKPLPIGGCSKDRQAGYGRAASGKAKGYKLHAIVGADGSLAAWRVAPMNKDERVMAGRMLHQAEVQGYIVTDANYDSNVLHKQCDNQGNRQMVTPRRYGKTAGHGHRKQTTGRLRSKDILENPNPKFGEDLKRQRTDIERYFGNLTSWGGGLTHLPPWVRGHRRVHRWVQAKLLLNHLRKQLLSTTCAA